MPTFTGVEWHVIDYNNKAKGRVALLKKIERYFVGYL
jgi:hypothetical protein